ncbi:hypothetical protein D6D13_07141 [Aureobasidium pullulans]|uniref:Microbial-type PARG catalytic domain-containing protein n=1 Tax=Aureobasidium pullulans TaxID=5580 RepID=A0A4S9CEQ2_AURPU|nr:hypothetical protein D6D13_07141 [Aureobasidium pullulans]
MLPDLATRRKICEDTIKRSEEITATTPDASLDSTFITSQTYPGLSPLDPVFPDLQLRPIQVIDSDTFACARSILSSDPEFRDKVAVLNLASDEEPGGGWRYTLSATQEEALCYSSTLYQTLKPEYYPWANTGLSSVAGIFSPGVVVFKELLPRPSTRGKSTPLCHHNRCTPSPNSHKLQHRICRPKYSQRVQR